ncbi:hypothetical protein [Nereida sp. MMG025]|uniref:hypothetical protein n=1 Tax=Nereida sp. MMG025 TaxID=2909981 RepID=UPI001F209B0C|nr:hypothetical protein [Nereida sp. MMG025]MCF6444531.1 hypothetical protein [Nereida sp. MMG025]
MRQSIVIFAVILTLVTAPAALSLGHYLISDSATRPFDFYRQAGARIGLFRTSDIQVTLYTNRTDTKRAALEGVIRNAFEARDYHIDVAHAPRQAGSRETLVIKVGANAYGPYNISQASSAIMAALTAQNMRNR